MTPASRESPTIGNPGDEIVCAPPASEAASQPFSARTFLEQSERDDDLAALVRGVITAGLQEPDCAFAEEYCLRLARHWHYNVRGNALQALWHLQRRGGVRSPALVAAAAAAALQDESDYVRSQAEELEEAIGRGPGPTRPKIGQD